MPPNHRHYAQWSPERFLRWAEQIGRQTRDLIQAALDSRRHPQQAYRICLGTLNLARACGKERLEAACGRALASGIHNYRGVKNILDARLDQLILEEVAPAAPDGHANIRGSSYYRQLMKKTKARSLLDQWRRCARLGSRRVPDRPLRPSAGARRAARGEWRSE